MVALINPRRLQKGAFASLLAIVVRMAIQFLQVPILYRYWPSDQASAWLLIWTLPSYMALTVGAFGTAGGNQVVSAAGAEDLAGARAAFRATRIAIAASTALLALTAILAFPALIDLSHWGVDRATTQLTLLGITLYVAATIFASSQQVAYRYGGDYGGYGYLDSLASAAELAVMLLVLVSTTTLWVLPACLAITRLCAAVLVSLRARYRWPQIYAPADPGQVRAALRTMIVPFLGFMTAPVLLAININGYSLLVSTAFGPALFATFLTVRTLVRLADIGVNLTYSVLSMELSYLTGAAENQRIVRFMAGVAFAGLMACGIYVGLLVLFGEPLQHLWTSGKVGYSAGLVLVFGGCVVLRAVSVPFTALLASRNAHSLPNAIYLALTTAAFGASLLGARLGGGLIEVTAWQLGVEALQLICVAYFCARQVDRGFAGFVVDVCRFGPETVLELARSVVGRRGLKLDGRS